MDVETNNILSFDTQQIGSGVSSVGLEKIVCRNALDYFLSNDVKIFMICMDRHVAIRKMLREEYSDIKHEFDVWHLVKSIGKTLLAASKRKQCKDLTEWISPIKNHIWWSGNTCKKYPDELLVRLNSVLNHVRDIYTWEDDNSQYTSCKHAVLDEEVETPKKMAGRRRCKFEALKKMIKENRLQKDLRQISYFCHTGDLEVFHSALTKYTPKRLHFSANGMIARTQLAALDHNFTVNRSQAVVKKQSESSGPVGTQRYNVAYSKARKEWFLRSIYEPTKQDFISTIMKKVFDAAAGNLPLE
ncbi:uncharacterized protein LOC130297972 [Hyla sarda]|uniref:uncharacterized protein LOC130297972 n=1 Tax=Hyla sarda TaxID=327740 RepID=UPI0024C373E8|nr:uncharacterized protein LOC130297972 [Hyla sarda]XP_056406821.1 uncharacterized protein LOC130297972 [Hyla sarda]XP_056406822.1 uncharacterized protein LOC130297972 [Hyla sarda]